MIASRVISESELEEKLASLGYARTTLESRTGTIWFNDGATKPIQVPHSIQGFYPDWLLLEIENRVGASLS